MDKTFYLSQLDDYLQDHERVVTYKWLSREINAPAGVAKQMLYSYWQQQKAKGDPVQALFFVGGVDSADPTLRRFVLVPEAELASAKAKFSQVTSCHVYSLQRALPKDPDTVLYTTDYDIVRDNLDATARLGGIGAPPTIQLREPLVLPERSTSVSETAPAASSISRTPSVGSSAYKKAKAANNVNTISAKDFFGKRSDSTSSSKAASSAASKPAAPASKPTVPAAAPAPAAAAAKSEPKRRLKNQDSDASDNEEESDAPAASKAKTVSETKAAAEKPAEKPAADAKPKTSAPKPLPPGSPPKQAKTKAPAESATKSEEPAAAAKKAKADGDAEADEKKKKKPTSEAAKKTAAKEDPAPAPAAAPKASVRPEDIDVPKTRIVKKVVRKTFTDPSGYLVSEEVEEEEEVELAPEEIEAERKRVAAKMNRQAAPAAPTGAAGKSKSASAPASGAKKQASLMSFFGKK